MIALPDIRYYRWQTVESTAVQKWTEGITAVAFHIFHTLKYAALIPAIKASLVIRLPVIIVTFSLSEIACGMEFASKNLQSYDPIPNNTLKWPVLAIDSIAKSLIPKTVHFLNTVASSPCILVKKSIDYIEDKSIEITQNALDTLGIPVKLHISRKKLLSILNNWKLLGLPDENREKACERIVACYDRSNELIRNFFSFSQNLSIQNYGLRTLPEIFYYKPFSKLTNIYLDYNQLTSLPLSIYDLPSRCQISISYNLFPEEEVLRILHTINRIDYRGPTITGINTDEDENYLEFFNEEEENTAQTIQDSYKNLYQAVGRVPEDLSNLKPSDALRSWLTRLSTVSAYSQNEPIKKAFITHIITYLEEANRNLEFQTIFAHIVQDASETCGDRVALSVLHLDIAYQRANIDLSHLRKLSEFLLRGCFAIDLLEECARQKVQSIQDSVDEVEVYLGYPIYLKKELNLPISQETMLYFPSNLLTHEDLTTAKEFVLSYLNNPEACLTFLTHHDLWKKALANYNRGAFNAIENKKVQALENATSGEECITIENEYYRALKELSMQAIQ